MDKTFKEVIRLFVFERDSEHVIRGLDDPFWQGWKNVGNELWPDTGNMEEAEKLWKE